MHGEGPGLGVQEIVIDVTLGPQTAHDRMQAGLSGTVPTMGQLSADRYFHQIEANTDLLADMVAAADPGLPVPSCPGWTLRQLATHLGRTQRWVAEITDRRSAEGITFREVPDGKYPENRTQQAPWLRAGARRVVGAVRAAGTAPVWAFAGSEPATFWARRMTHEALVHRVDGQLAVGQQPVIEAAIAADAIAEWLMLVSGPKYHSPVPRAAALPPGAVMHVHATDDGLAGDGEWLVSQTADGITVGRGHAKGDVAISGPAANVLLALLRRQPATDPSITVYGEASLLAGWLANTPF